MTSVTLLRVVPTGAGIVAALCALTSLALPFFIDQGDLALVGGAYVRGDLPYVGIWDIKGPLAYLPSAIAEVMFGKTMWGVRVFDILFCLGASYVFYRSLRPLTSVVIAGWAAYALYFWTASTGWVYTSQPESWVGALAVFAIAPLIPNSRTLAIRMLFLSGLLTGCMGLVKPPYFAVGIAPFLVIASATGSTLSRRTILVLALATGTATPVAVALACFAAHGALNQAVEAYILFNLSTYAGLHPGTSTVSGWTEFLARPTVTLLTPFIALAICSMRKQLQVLLPLLGWLAALLLVVTLQGKYFAYHWLPVFAPMLYLAALGAHVLARNAEDWAAPRLTALLAALAFTAHVCTPPLLDAAKFVYYFVLKQSPHRYYASYSFTLDGEMLYRASDELDAAQYIKAHTNPGDAVFPWGTDQTAVYLAGRPTPSRFIMQFPMILPGPYRQKYQNEISRALLVRPPVYIVVGKSWWRPDTKAQTLAKFPALFNLLTQGYRLETTFGNIDLYRKNPSSTAQVK